MACPLVLLRSMQGEQELVKYFFVFLNIYKDRIANSTLSPSLLRHWSPTRPRLHANLDNSVVADLDSLLFWQKTNNKTLVINRSLLMQVPIQDAVKLIFEETFPRDRNNHSEMATVASEKSKTTNMTKRLLDAYLISQVKAIT